MISESEKRKIISDYKFKSNLAAICFIVVFFVFFIMMLTENNTPLGNFAVIANAATILAFIPYSVYAILKFKKLNAMQSLSNDMMRQQEERIAMGIIDDAKKKASEIISQAQRDAEAFNRQASSAKKNADEIINNAYKEAARIKQEIQEEFWKSPEGRSVMAERHNAEVRKEEREHIAKITRQLADEELRRNREAMENMMNAGG